MPTSNLPRFYLPVQATSELRALVVGWNDEPIKPADLSACTYSLYLVDEIRNTLSEVSAAEFTPEAITPAGIFHAALQEWDEDDVGFNFHHVPPNKIKFPFAKIGGLYRLIYTCVPANPANQNVALAFEIMAE